MTHLVISILVVLSICMFGSNADTSTCTFKDPSTGKLYDLSGLINPSGYYTFQQQVWSIGGYSLDSLVADSKTNVTFYLQVCRNILIQPPGCEDVGAIYSVTPDGKCLSWGNANVSIFDLNPYKDGVNLKLYHGTALDHLSYNAAIIYFTCNQNKLQDELPAFEHVKGAINQAHFAFPTHLAC